MSPQPKWSDLPPCKRCAGLAGVHYLTCPSLRLPPGGWRAWGPDEED